MTRAALLIEWQIHYSNAVRFRSKHPHLIANVLTFGRADGTPDDVLQAVTA